jgi:hypothetical protein
LSFFGLEYVKYQKEVPRSGVPFVKGYLTTEEETEPYADDNTLTDNEDE